MKRITATNEEICVHHQERRRENGVLTDVSATDGGSSMIPLVLSDPWGCEPGRVAFRLPQKGPPGLAGLRQLVPLLCAAAI